MTLELSVFEKNKSPKISLSREIEIEDFANVDDRNNAILFIFEDEKGWTFFGNKAVLKLRFKLADELKEKLDKHKGNASIFAYASNFWKVHRFEVKKDEATPEKEDELKMAVKKLIEGSIQMINYIADTKF